MQIRRLTSSLDTFREIEFHEGLNLLVADKSRSRSGNSRNGTGKTSVVYILRYLLGGDRVEALKSPTLVGVTFTLTMNAPELDPNGSVDVSRVVGQPKVIVKYSDGVNREFSLKDWNSTLARTIFRLPEGALRPTLPQIRAQSLRTGFDPVKMNPSESEWESGARVGFLMGMNPEAFVSNAEVAKLEKQQKALNQAAKDGVFSSVGGDPAEIEADLATARLRAQRIAQQLRDFTVDELYREHQDSANRLSQQIRDLNDSAIALGSRLESLKAALDEASSPSTGQGREFVSAMYEEAGIILPDLIVRRFDEVASFHESVLENRRARLQGEIEVSAFNLREIESRRADLDIERSRTLKLLEASMALESYQQLVSSASEIESRISDGERRIEFMRSITTISDDVKISQIKARQHIEEALADSSEQVNFARARFVELAEEIYGQTDTGGSRAALKIGASSRDGFLKIEPIIRSDGSSGIKSVQAFLMDQVLMESAAECDRWSGFLVHDSGLFDGVDSEQIADCLNIGARIAESYNAQYIVSINSDTLRQAVLESKDAFDAQPYKLATVLGDASDSDRLFGVQLASWKSD